MSDPDFIRFVSFLAVNLALVAGICLVAATVRPTWFR